MANKAKFGIAMDSLNKMLDAVDYTNRLFSKRK
jgi:hypothetical protein